MKIITSRIRANKNGSNAVILLLAGKLQLSIADVRIYTWPINEAEIQLYSLPLIRKHILKRMKVYGQRLSVSNIRWIASPKSDVKNIPNEKKNNNSYCSIGNVSDAY